MKYIPKFKFLNLHWGAKIYVHFMLIDFTEMY